MHDKILCPNCKKPTLELYAGWETGNYICKKCGYLGPIALHEYRNKPKKRIKIIPAKSGNKNHR